MSIRYDVGSVGKHVPLTKPVQTSWSKQSLNLFTDSDQANLQGSNQADAIDAKPSRQFCPGGPVSSANPLAFPCENVPAPVPSTKVHAAPGGKSSMSDIFSGVGAVAEPPKSSIRLYQGAASTVFSQEPVPQPVPSQKKNPAFTSNIFDDGTVATRTGRSHVIIAGQNQMVSTVFSADAPIEPVHSIRSAKMNIGHNIFEAAAPEPPSSQYSARKNQSNNVLNLTPKAPERITSRTARVNSESNEEFKPKQTNRTSKANEESTAEFSMPVHASKHAKHNEMMAGSNIFSDAPAAPVPSRTRKIIQAPGGASSNMFA